MRLGTLVCLLLVLIGISAAQETNFPVGPQYLMTNGSPLFARPIATPTLSFETPSAAPEMPSLTGGGIVTTPAAPQNQADLVSIYYGAPTASVIEISSAEPPSGLPASIVNIGVAGTTDAQSLLERGVGVTVGEAASYWKAHKGHSARVFTNADVNRLHGG